MSCLFSFEIFPRIVITVVLEKDIMLVVSFAIYLFMKLGVSFLFMWTNCEVDTARYYKNWYLTLYRIFFFGSFLKVQ